MGQKVHPTGIRLGIVKDSNARWFPHGDTFANTLRSDIEIRKFALERLPEASSISKIIIERSGKNVKVIIRTAKPGVIIGKKGGDVEKLRVDLIKKIGCGVNIKK